MTRRNDQDEPMVVDPELAQILLDLDQLDADITALTQARAERLALEEAHWGRF
jgi:hypothetical protein